ncbi:MAG: cytochrome c family protein [Hyphomicrobiaceae bacterium]|nr:cytochrome c family protein [Hyphomicrobiaceae bacterium]
MMDSFELSKIAGAVLSALLLIFGTKTVIDIKMADHGGDHHVVGYQLPMPKEAAAAAPDAKAAAAPVAAEAAFDAAKVVGLVATASADDGKGVFKKCAACHSVDQGGANKLGPNLWGIVGRPVAAVEGFGYSDSLKGKGGAWTLDQLAGFLHNPKAYAAGTKMVFAGLPAESDLANVLAYLNSLK